MGIFGKWRGNSGGEISQPVLTFSDAAPRDDLRRLWAIESPKQAVAEPAKPRTGKAAQEFHDAVQAFDFTVTEPPEGLATEYIANDTTGGSMIGIALGSPSMLPPPPQFQPVEWYTPTSEAPSEKLEPSGTLKRKPSKWKKLGGLLKGKQDERKQKDEPFYQLDMNSQPYSQHETRSRIQDSPPTVQFPTIDNGISPHATSKPIPEKNFHDNNHQQASDGSLLQIDIPTVQMERYSVMFSSVLGQKPASSLLARRNKDLYQIQVHNRRDNNTLQPQLPQRRATSPGPAKSPAFSLFPTSGSGTSAKPLDVATAAAAAVPSEPKSPRRSNTFPVEAPRSQNKNTHLTVPDLTPALSSGTSLDYYSSTEVSPTGIETPLEETIPRPKITPRYVEHHEPVWEMVTKRSDSPASITTTSAHVSTNTTPATSPEEVAVSTKSNQPPRKDSLYPPRVSSRDHDLPPNRPTIRARSQTMPTPLKINNKTVSVGQLPQSQQRKVVISTARSVSVTGRVPIQSSASLAPSSSVSSKPSTRERHFQFESNEERFGEHQKLVPTVVDIRRGSAHQHKKSENVVIETL